MIRRIALAVALTTVGLAGRALIDKSLALRAGADVVALWAQLQSVMELVTGVVLAGVGTGLSVLVAQTCQPQERARLLRAALSLGLGIALPVAMVLAAASVPLSHWATGNRVDPALIAAAALVGWLSVIPGLVNGFWLGQQRRQPMLVLALTANGAVLLAAWVTSPRWVFPGLLLASCLPALGLAAWLWARRAGDGKFAPVGDGMRTLSHYLVPGLSIGILSPLSWLVIRGLTSESMSWQGTALMLALSRVSDWVTVIAATALYLFFLPRMSSAAQDGRLLAEIGRAALRVLVPSAAALAMLGVFQREVLVALYDPTFVVPDRAVALFFAGDLARVSAWIFLYALYAQRRTLAIALGEVLSLPLFAFLLFCLGPRMTLETAGLAWLATYLVYAGFCAWAALRVSGRNDARMLQHLNNRVGASPIDRST